ncbi:hypothetical protein GMRT_10571 [Giardia muris]|uniref:Uncharacterized protein n=1 Tax=Giardia muris TaxID=5742 RepID=A0A4Z1SMN8_GIAMU|nr:hypothetical protein GMRT_10571 [Giardia muris]|eukprot:TNJ26850.1 hypothetical protein GMRT_10571 [Giardia muris]
MRARACLRSGQRLEEIGEEACQDEGVCVYASSWVRALAERLIPGPVEIVVTDGEKGRDGQRRVLTVADPLLSLCMLARNEARNVTGCIRKELYQGFGPGLAPEKLYSLKDLVKLIVIVGLTHGRAYGGFGGASPLTTCAQRLYLVDLIGLQFQQPYNTGRLVLHGPGVPRGELDDEIFSRVVGEPRPTLDDVQRDKTGRYRRCGGGTVYFDTHAYQSFVAFDFCQACVALNAAVASRATGDALHFKFLRYGAGFFSGAYQAMISANIHLGVARGVEVYGRTASFKAQNAIRYLELPFFPRSEEILRACEPLGIRCLFSHDDALKPPSTPDCVLAVTNCADPHVVTGNEMHHSSVDAAIAENLRDRGASFSPFLNRRMRTEVVSVQ